jgi:hypothetical protein
MTVQTLKLKGERYVLLREKDYRALSRKAAGGERKSAGGNGKAKTSRLTAQDMGDIAEVTRRKADPKNKSMPYEQVRKRLGLA